MGDKKRVNAVSRILKKAGVQARPRGRPKNKTLSPKLPSQKSTSAKSIKLESFNADIRLSLIDEALSHLKASLSDVYSPKGFSEWASALERLLEQRRLEAPAAPVSTEDDGLMVAFETKTVEVWQNAPNIPIQVDSAKHPAMEDTDMVDGDISSQKP